MDCAAHNSSEIAPGPPAPISGAEALPSEREGIEPPPGVRPRRGGTDNVCPPSPRTAPDLGRANGLREAFTCHECALAFARRKDLERHRMLEGQHSPFFRLGAKFVSCCVLWVSVGATVILSDAQAGLVVAVVIGSLLM